MDKTDTNTELENDVLHFKDQSKLSAAEIAKAIAHHNRHHPERPQQDSSAGPKPANKGR
jgi:hypothetical protein